MQRSLIVRPAAMFWGLTVFMPVGITYVAAVLLLATLLCAGGLRDRAQRLRGTPMWWPVMAYVAWTLVILAFGPHYAETGSNLFHGLRIALTILMALALTREEAIWAVRGFWLMGLVNIVMIGLFYTVGFPLWEPWRGVIILIGNKSISNALLFTIMAASAVVYGLQALVEHRRWQALAAFALVPAVIAIISLTLPSRTSLLALLLAIPAACVHQWRRQLKVLAVVLVIGGAVAAAALWNTPVVQQKFAVGIQEIEAAKAGEISEASWVVRYYMYRDTARMIIDRPLAGWGIGAWTEQWHLRGPKLLGYKNMPHNDFLWMGSQTGVPGALTLIVIMGMALWLAWRRDDQAGRLAFVATLIMFIATSVNSALRDAQIGLALLWVAMVYLRLAQAPGDSWRDLLPAALRRGSAAAPA